MADMLRDKQRRGGTRRTIARPKRLVRAAIGAALVIVAVWLIAAYLVMPQLAITRVVVRADFEIARDQILELAGLDGDPTYLSADPEAISARLAGHPQVRSATVDRQFPGTVRIELERRRPLVALLVEVDGRTASFALDETGTIFERGSQVALQDLPVLSGVELRGNPIGVRLPETLLPLIERLHSVRYERPDLFASISEVRIDPRAFGEFDVLIYAGTFGVPVRMNPTVDVTGYTYGLLVLDVLSRQGLAERVAEVDVRSGQVVYRFKEDADGE